MQIETIKVAVNNKISHKGKPFVNFKGMTTLDKVEHELKIIGQKILDLGTQNTVKNYLSYFNYQPLVGRFCR